MYKYWLFAFYFTGFILLCGIDLPAQNGVLMGDGVMNHPKAILELRSNSKGFRVPRVTDAQQTAIAAYATPGLLVYNTTTPGYRLRFFDGTTFAQTNTGDNLGTSTATQRLNLATYQLVGNGGSSGIYIGSTGNAAVGATSFDATNPEKLKVNEASTSVNVISANGTFNDNLQLLVKNSNAGTSASSDFVVTNNAGTETTGYLDLGINSSAYNVAGYNITGKNDSYLYGIGSATGAGTGGNLSIGTQTSGTVLKFHTSGTTSAEERMRIGSTGNIRIGTSTSDATSTLQVEGSLAFPVRRIVNSTVINATDPDCIFIVNNGGSITLTLPQASLVPGRIYVIKKVSDTPGRDVTINVSGAGGRIDTYAGITLNIRTEFLIVQSNGSRYYTLQVYTP